MYHLCIVIILGVLGLLFAKIDSGSSLCRCLPGETCWPTQAEWDQLNSTLYGKLTAPKPTGYPCYAGPGFDAATCQQIKQPNTRPAFLINNPGSMQAANWEDLGQFRCSVESSAIPNTTCQQGSVSVYGVAVTSVADIQTAMLFARQHNLRVVIKSSGHDLLGRSAAPGSFLIWLHKFTKVESKLAFTPEGCDASQASDGPVVTVQGGTTWREAYQQVDGDFNGTRCVIGATCGTVSASGGYITGGGHSLLAPTFGLAVDNVLEAQIVTVDGKLLTTNKCQNNDLYWAVRGGGGGTFGVIVSVTYKLHPLPLGLLAFSALITNPDKSGNLSAIQLQNVLEVIARHTDELDKSGWGGYFYANPAFGLILLFIAPRPETSGVENEATSRMESVRDELVGLQDRLGIIVSPVPPSSGTGVTRYMRFTDWIDLYNSSPMGVPPPGELRIYLGSRMIPKAAFSNPTNVAQTVTAAITANGLHQGLNGHLVSGRGVSDNPNANETSVTPAWRRSAWLIVLPTTWSYDATDEQIQQGKMALNAGVQVLRDAYPDSGTFSNEAFLEEPDWQHTLWGDNYDRLLKIKKDVDPDGFLTCTECVGSELRDQSGDCPKVTPYILQMYG